MDADIRERDLKAATLIWNCGCDRETPHEYQRKPKAWKIDPFRAYLREPWKQGVENASRLFRELQKKGYGGCIPQVRNVVQPWRLEGRERAFVRFETAPGQQAQLDWGHFGNWARRRLYGFAPRTSNSFLAHRQRPVYGNISKRSGIGTDQWSMQNRQCTQRHQPETN